MNRTTRCLSGRGSGRWSLASRLVFSLLAVAIAAPAIADDSIGFAEAGFIDTAEAGFYVQAGAGPLQGQFTGTYYINDLLGADRFYNAGFNGTNAVMANIEAGYAWYGHESLAHTALIPVGPGALGEIDRHATWVAMVMGGRPGGTTPGPHQQGMAPNAQLFTGAIATGWVGTRFSTAFNVNFGALSTWSPFRAALVTGVAGNGNPRTADVVNLSWQSSQGLTGTDQLAGTLDALIYENPRSLVVTAAGNLSVSPPGTAAGPNRVLSPASSYNDMTVAALSSNGGSFDVAARFSRGGPNDYGDPVNATVFAARQVIDIAAPGEGTADSTSEGIAAAYYGGETGGNRPTLSGLPNGPAGGPDWYSRNVRGTSFSAPTVAGGAALLYDTAYAILPAIPDARDARVMKAVLMNSADKTLAWNNGQVAHPNGNGGVLTTQSLDSRVGAGRLNLDRAFDQFLGGTTDVAGTASGLVGTVETIGWDFGRVVDGATNDYLLDLPLAGGSTFTATLDWFRRRETFGVTSYSDISFDNLDLELWSALGGSPTALVAESKSQYNNAEHFSFAIPSTGEYLLRVRLAGQVFDVQSNPNIDFYGLAWAGVEVPEPATLALLAAAIVALPIRGRRKQSSDLV